MKPPSGTNRKSGVYRITCIESGRVYIGSAVNIGGRIRGHIHDLNRRRHANRFLQRAWDKYGPDGFTVEVVEFCSPESLLDREQSVMDAHDCVQPKGFNIQPFARSSLGVKRSPEHIKLMRDRAQGKPLSPETRKKISEALKIACRGKKVPWSMIEKARIHNTGRPLTEIQRQRMSEARKGKPRPDGLMQKLAEFNRGKKRSVETIEKIKATKLRNRKNG